MTSWRDLLKIHPAAELFPLMGPDESKALGENINAQNGLKHPIILWFSGACPLHRGRYALHKVTWDDVVLLDGRNRLDAIETAGFKALFRNAGYNGPRLIMTKPAIDEDGDEYDEELDIETKCLFEIDGMGEKHDPYAYVISANIHRRHLTTAQKGELIAALLKAKPERSDRATAKIAQVDHKTVAAKREKLEGGGEIPHHETRVGKDGVAQPAEKPPTRTQARAFHARDADMAQGLSDPLAEPERPEGSKTVRIDVTHEERVVKLPVSNVTYTEIALRPAVAEIAKLSEAVTSKAPETPAVDHHPLSLLKKCFVELSLKDRFLFREWVVEQKCGE
jgi:hypothetical protein